MCVYGTGCRKPSVLVEWRVSSHVVSNAATPTVAGALIASPLSTLHSYNSYFPMCLYPRRTDGWIDTRGRYNEGDRQEKGARAGDRSAATAGYQRPLESSQK